MMHFRVIGSLFTSGLSDFFVSFATASRGEELSL
jgi:hypothetical protein